jgi:PAS domain S-box-containing protein
VKNYTAILIVCTLILVGFFLSWYVDRSYERYLNNQQALMQQSTRGAARIIELYIREVRRRVDLFTEEEGTIIGKLSLNPTDEAMEVEFADRVKRHFPDFFTYTITDSLGTVLLDDIEGKIANLCQADIHHFAGGESQQVFIHPNPLGYHFDIMSIWESLQGDRGIFFISINPAVLARILANSQLHDHELILLHRDKPGFIEITAAGTRADLQGQTNLAPEQLARISVTEAVEGSLWTLADVPAANLFAKYKNRLWRQAASVFLVFLLFSTVMAVLIRRADLQRSSAERAVRESRNQLEMRVDSRTRQLSAINSQLESEIDERHRAEQALKHEIDERRQTENTLRALHEITSAHKLPFNDKVRALLENGCRQFGLPIGILARIDGESYEVIEAISPDNSIVPGAVFELGNTYCRETVKADGPIGFEHAAHSDWKSHPCYQAFKLETYLGIPVAAGSKVYGTLNFSSPTPRKKHFTATDVEMLRLMGQWVGSEIYRQQTEQALKQERDKVQRYLDVAGVIMLVIGADQRVSLINKRGCELLGADERDIIGSNWFDNFVPAESREEIRAFFVRLLAREEELPEYFQRSILTRRGEERLIAWHNKLLYDESGNITATLSSGEDITVQQQALEQLRQREEQLRLTLENAPIGILTSGLDGRLLSVNPAFCNILGYSAEELTRLSVEDITHPDDWEETSKQFDALVRGDIDNYELEKRYLRRDSAVITARARAGLVRDAQGRPLMVVGEVEDISQRQRTEKIFQLVVETAPNAIVMIDSGRRIVLVNSQTERYFGYRRDELLGKPIEVLIPERMRMHHPEYVEQFKSEHRARPMGLGRDLYGLRKDGSEFPVEVGLSPVETGQELLILSAIVDISERVSSNRELQRMRTYLKNIIDSMPSVLVGVDKKGRVTEWNQSAEKATGVPTGDAIGQPFNTLFPELESQLENIREAIRTHAPLHTERLITEKDGETRYADVMVYPLLANGAAGAVIRVDDITNRVRIEQMMVQTEKMMSVGGLAAGMAHEINNPLSGVLQSSQNIQRRLSPELEPNRRAAEALGVDLERLHRYLDERGILGFVDAIQQSASRASHIVADMLAYSRSSSIDFQPARVVDMLETVVRLAASDYDLKKKYDFKQIEIVRDFDPQLDTLVCDHTEIEQVLLNLIKNAAQAMTEGGAQPSDQRIILRTRREEEYGCIEIQDNGPGMDPQTQRRVFEPFFTTKAAGVGTGLGLSVSYFIVTEQHKGTIDVSSNPGEGTCFTVRLPLHWKPAA